MSLRLRRPLSWTEPRPPRGRRCPLGMGRSPADGGFSLVELLAVMAIVGILSAIAIPAYLSHRATARDTGVNADVTLLGREISTYYVANSTPPSITVSAGRYVVAGADAGPVTSGVSLVTSFGAAATTTGSSAVTTGWTSAAWCIALTDPQGKRKTFKVSARNGLQQGQCASATTP